MIYVNELRVGMTVMNTMDEEYIHPDFHGLALVIKIEDGNVTVVYQKSGKHYTFENRIIGLKRVVV